MNEIIAYKDHNNEYYDHEIVDGVPIKSKSEDALNIISASINFKTLSKLLDYGRSASLLMMAV